jgi:hypothetical protein
MRAYPILYLTLAVICGVFAVGGIVGFSTANQNLPQTVNQAGFFLSWLPVSMAVFSIISVIFWIIGLVHCLTNKSLQGNEKIVWILVVILLNALGSVLYFFLAPNPAYAGLLAEQKA